MTSKSKIITLAFGHGFEWLIAIAIAAVIGKVAGGWLADKTGWDFMPFHPQ